MEWIDKFRAYVLSNSGDHTRALAASTQYSARILSKAGMHLSVLKMDKQKTEYIILAKIACGQYDGAFSLARTEKKLSANVLGALSSVDLQRTVEELSGQLRDHSNLSATLYALLGELDGSPYLGNLQIFNQAVHQKNINLQEQQLNKYLASHDLKGVSIRATNISTLKDIYFSNAESRAKRYEPLVSIIMSAFNEAENIEASIKSLQNQTWKNLEIIVFDDASIDQTSKIVRSLSIADDRIKLVRQSKNIGTWRCKNEGIKLSKGEYLMMQDADDVSHPEKIERQIRALKLHSNAKSVSSNRIRIDATSGLLFSRNYTNFNCWDPSSFLFHRELAEKLGYYYTNLLGADCEYVARAETCFGVRSHVRLRIPLSLSLQRKNSLSNKFRGNDALQRIEDWETWRWRHVAAVRNNLSHLYVGC